MSSFKLVKTLRGPNSEISRFFKMDKYFCIHVLGLFFSEKFNRTGPKSAKFQR